MNKEEETRVKGMGKGMEGVWNAVEVYGRNESGTGVEVYQVGCCLWILSEKRSVSGRDSRKG